MTSGPDFRQTLLWRQAFEKPRTDAAAEEQEYFRTQYGQLRDKAAQLVNRIAVDVPGMTVHDITHLDALWDMASLVAEGAISLKSGRSVCIRRQHSASRCGDEPRRFPQRFG
jgi:hypothetical protein